MPLLAMHDTPLEGDAFICCLPSCEVCERHMQFQILITILQYTWEV